MRTKVLALALAFAGHAHAANMSVLPPDGAKPAVIAIQGRFEYEDGEKFTKHAARFQNAIVVFESDGGNLLAGLHIGRTVHQKKFWTLVPGNVRCASACALAWLGGVQRFMGSGARVGFHAAFDARSQQESGAANALVGAYLKEIGLDYPAVFYITQAPPQSMTWLSLEDAGRLGIQVTLLESPAAKPKLSDMPARPSDVQLKNRVLSIMVAFFRKWSETNETGWVEQIYAEQVSYYGNPRPREAVIADKLNFAERWPERRFRLRYESFDIACDPASAQCKAVGIVDWQIRHAQRDETRTGSTTFTFVIAFAPDSFRIVAEHGELLRRESESPPPQQRPRPVETDTEDASHQGDG